MGRSDADAQEDAKDSVFYLRTMTCWKGSIENPSLSATGYSTESLRIDL